MMDSHKEEVSGERPRSKVVRSVDILGVLTRDTTVVVRERLECGGLVEKFRVQSETQSLGSTRGSSCLKT